MTDERVESARARAARMGGRPARSLGLVMRVGHLAFDVSPPGFSFEVWHASTVAREDHVLPAWTAHAAGPALARPLAYGFRSKDRALAWLQVEMTERLARALS